jgi:predicted GIY-YIG superfamily endonuclease
MRTNRPNGTLYTGVTNDLIRRAFEHREGIVTAKLCVPVGLA